MGLDGKQTNAKKQMLETLRSEGFRQRFPSGATATEIAIYLSKTQTYASDNLTYLRHAGLVLRDREGRFMAAPDGGKAQGAPVVTRQATPEELDRVRAGLPSDLNIKLTREQQQRLDDYRSSQK